MIFKSLIKILFADMAISALFDKIALSFSRVKPTIRVGDRFSRINVSSFSLCNCEILSISDGYDGDIFSISSDLVALHISFEYAEGSRGTKLKQNGSAMFALKDCELIK